MSITASPVSHLPPAVVQVACGVIVNAAGEVLLAQRPAGKIAEGYWEFPGGKVEAGESAEAALSRELQEEIGVTVRRAHRLIRFAHHYSNRSVMLDTWCITAFDGTPQGREQQALQWVVPSRLDQIAPLLPTVWPAIRALRAPSHYVFTPDVAAPQLDVRALSCLPQGAALRLRWPQLSDAAYAAAAAQWLPAAQALGLRVVLDRAPELAQRLKADGWHAPAARWQAGERPPAGLWSIASVHQTQELAAVAAQDFHAAVLGPVFTTATHPGVQGLGWGAFESCRGDAALTVYAIGGVTPQQLDTARRHNAQGIAGIRPYWLKP